MRLGYNKQHFTLNAMSLNSTMNALNMDKIIVSDPDEGTCKARVEVTPPEIKMDRRAMTYAFIIEIDDAAMWPVSHTKIYMSPETLHKAAAALSAAANNHTIEGDVDSYVAFDG